MRILVGTVEIGGIINCFADGFRLLGHQVTSVCLQRNPFYPEHKYDIESHKDALPPDVISALITTHDVFFFIWGKRSLLPENAEFPLLKKLGKRIVSLFCGSDVRHYSAYGQQYGIHLEDVDESYRGDPLVRPLGNLRRGECYSDLIISVPNQSSLAVRPYVHYFIPMKISRYQFNVPGREVPVIIHAPSNKSRKGTDIILAALERLRFDSVPFELRLLHGVSNRQVLAELVDADIAIDQLYASGGGLFTREAIASGCAVATHNSEEHDSFPRNRPLWNIDAQNIYHQLKRLLTDKSLRIRLACQGRQYVEKYYNHVRVAQRIIDCLNPAHGQIHYDYYPTFFAQKYHIPTGEIIPDNLKRMTAEIVQYWGLPEDVDPQDMIARGLMLAEELDLAKPIPRWKSAPSSGKQ